MSFIKLSAVEKITIKEVGGLTYKMWDDANKKMLSSDTPKAGYVAKTTVECEEGTLDLSNAQMTGILAALKVEKPTKDMLKNTTFNVLSNGLEGKERRYFFMLVGTTDVPTPNLYSTPEKEDSVVAF